MNWEIGIDHLLVGEIAPDTVLLKSGWFAARFEGISGCIDSTFFETAKGRNSEVSTYYFGDYRSGRSTPIFATVLADPMLRHHFSLGVIIAVVDSFNASLHEQLHPEWMAQVTSRID